MKWTLEVLLLQMPQQCKMILYMRKSGLFLVVGNFQSYLDNREVEPLTRCLVDDVFVHQVDQCRRSAW